MTKKQAKRRASMPYSQVRTQGLPLYGADDVKEIREGLGISQAELARNAGVSRAAIANLESTRYAMAAEHGVELFLALFRSVSRTQDAPVYRERARQAALKLIADLKEEKRQKVVNLQYQIEKIEKEAAELNSKSARLQAQESSD